MIKQIFIYTGIDKELLKISANHFKHDTLGILKADINNEYYKFRKPIYDTTISIPKSAIFIFKSSHPLQNGYYKIITNRISVNVPLQLKKITNADAVKRNLSNRLYLKITENNTCEIYYPKI